MFGLYIAKPKSINANAAIKKQNELIPQHIANLLWALATNGQFDQAVFQSLAPTAKSLVCKFNSTL